MAPRKHQRSEAATADTVPLAEIQATGDTPELPLQPGTSDPPEGFEQRLEEFEKRIKGEFKGMLERQKEEFEERLGRQQDELGKQKVEPEEMSEADDDDDEMNPIDRYLCKREIVRGAYTAFGYQGQMSRRDFLERLKGKRELVRTIFRDEIGKEMTDEDLTGFFEALDPGPDEELAELFEALVRAKARLG